MNGKSLRNKYCQNHQHHLLVIVAICKTFLLSTVYTNSSFNWHQYIFRTGTFQLHIHHHMTITAVSRLCSKLFYCLNHKVKMVKEIVDTNTYHSSFCCFKMSEKEIVAMTLGFSVISNCLDF